METTQISAKRFHVGSQVVRKGFEKHGDRYRGTVTAVFAGQLEGRIEVRLTSCGSIYVAEADAFTVIK